MNSPSYIAFAARKPFATVVIAALICAAIGAAAARVAPPRVKASIAFTVSERSRQETSDYAYDGYYAIRAAELVSDTVISWLSTPSVIKDIYEHAGIELTDQEALAAAGRAFRAKKYSSQNVVAAFTAPDAETADALAGAASHVLSELSYGLALDAGGDSLFTVTGSAPVIAPVSVSFKAAGAAGALVGAFLGFALAYVARARKDPQP